MMYGRVDVSVYQKGLALCQNCVVHPQGGASFRRGFVHVKHTNLNQPAVFIPFQFNNSQSYLLEFTNLSMTIYRNNGVVLDPATTKNITGVTKANPGVLSITAHGYSINDEVFVSGIFGMSELNGAFFYVNSVPNVNSITLKTSQGTVIDTTNFNTYISGGTTSKVLKIATPFAEAHLEDLKFAQTGDTMFITHNTYRTRLLTRASETSWVFTTPGMSGGSSISTSDPTTYPRAVCFSADCRLILAGTPGKPEGIWGSRTPRQSSGDTRFTDFGTPDVVDDIRSVDGYVYTLASLGGKVDYIEWISNTPKALIIGTQGSVRRMYGEVEGSSPTPLAVNARPVNNYGVDKAIPVSVGSSFFFIERGSQRIRNLNYDFQIDAYDTTNMNLAADHISTNVRQLVFQNAQPDVLWASRQDGKFIGLSYQERENVAGWHRHYMGGSHIDSSSNTQPYGKVIHFGIMGRSTKSEQLWAIVERRINNATLRSVEYMADEPRFPLFTDFYTGSKVSDKTKYDDACYEVQKDSVHLDNALIYDGTQTAGTITPGATSGTSVTFTSSTPVFTTTGAMAGREIWRKYDNNGNGGGRATIVTVTDSTHAVCDITQNFASTSAIPAGQWMLTTNKLFNAHNLEGQTVGLLLDGAPGTATTVTSGQITLPQQASKVVAGLRYVGLIQSLNLDFGGATGSAQNKPRKLNRVYLRFLNTIGAKVGTDIYDLESIRFTPNILNRGTPLFSGIIRKALFDKTTESEKYFAIMQDQPLPCTITSIDLFGETTDE